MTGLNWACVIACIVALGAAVWAIARLAHAKSLSGSYSNLQEEQVIIGHRRSWRNGAITVLVIAVLVTVFSFARSLDSTSIPTGVPLEPSMADTTNTTEPKVGDLSTETVTSTSTGEDAQAADSSNSKVNTSKATEAFQLSTMQLASFLADEAKSYYVPAVNPTSSEIAQFIKDYEIDIEVGNDNSLLEQKDARIKAVEAMGGSYTDPVDFPLPEKFRTGFREALAGKLEQKDYDALKQEFRKWVAQESVNNPVFGEMLLQTLNDLPRVTKNNSWITENEKIIDKFYAGTYQQPQPGDENYDELMKIELNAISTTTGTNVKGLDYLLTASDQSSSGFKPNEAWVKLAVRMNMLIEYFDIGDIGQRLSAKNWHLPTDLITENKNVRTEPAPYQVDEYSITFIYPVGTEAIEFGIVEDDSRTELYAKETPKKESTPPASTPPPSTSTPTPTPTSTPKPTSTPTPTPTPTGTPTPTPNPTKDPSQDPANQGNAPIGGGSNSDPDNPGDPQPTKPPAISKPNQGSTEPAVDIVGSGQHQSTGTGGNPNSVVNPSGNTDNGDHPGQQPDAAASGSKPVTGTDNNTGQSTTATTGAGGVTQGTITMPD